jgi:hypothetical protein
VFWFSFGSKHFQISLVISSLINCLFKTMMFNFCHFVNFFSFLLLIIYCILLSGKIFYIFFHHFSLLRLICVLTYVSPRKYSLCTCEECSCSSVGYSIQNIPVKPTWFTMFLSPLFLHLSSVWMFNPLLRVKYWNFQWLVHNYLFLPSILWVLLHVYLRFASTV